MQCYGYNQCGFVLHIYFHPTTPFLSSDPLYSNCEICRWGVAKDRFLELVISW